MTADNSQTCNWYATIFPEGASYDDPLLFNADMFGRFTDVNWMLRADGLWSRLQSANGMQ